MFIDCAVLSLLHSACMTDVHSFNSLFFQDIMGKRAPEMLNQSGF